LRLFTSDVTTELKVLVKAKVTMVFVSTNAVAYVW